MTNEISDETKIAYNDAQDLLNKISGLLSDYVENSDHLSHNKRILVASRAINICHLKWHLNLNNQMKEVIAEFAALDSALSKKQDNT